MPKIFISTAEASAELHASHLLRELRAMVPGLEANAGGGDLLAAAGATITVNMTGRAVMGFWEAAGQLMFYKRAADTILDALARERHDALVLVDAPSFHLRIAKIARSRWPDLPILYYIAPKLWAWKEWRVKNLRRDITRTLCIFPFEVEYFRERGVDAVYVGNPTLDELRDVDGSALARSHNLPDAGACRDPAHGTLAVFPGSRASEINYLWPVMVETVKLLQKRFPGLTPAVAVAPGWSERRLMAYAPSPDNTVFVGSASQELLAASSVVLAKSGTTTLEAALLGKPMAVCYIAHWLSYAIAKRFVKLPYVSLPNILSGRAIVPEYLQHEATPGNLAGEIGRLLSDNQYYQSQRQCLLHLRGVLGDEASAALAAREVARFCL